MTFVLGSIVCVAAIAAAYFSEGQKSAWFMGLAFLSVLGAFSQ